MESNTEPVKTETQPVETEIPAIEKPKFPTNPGNKIDFSQEFKLEMENSICNYFNKCQLEDEQIFKPKHELVRDETLIENENKSVEYITPTPSLNGISDFMIDQIFSTEKIIPIESDDEDQLEATEVVEETTKTTENNNGNKMSSCNSDVTLNNNVEDLDKVEIINRKSNNSPTPSPTSEERKKVFYDIINTLDVVDESNEKISKSFAVEFIDLLDINMKELNSKKDDFQVIGLKKEDEKEQEKNLNSTNEATEIKFKENENKETKPKSGKKSRHISIFNIERRVSTHLCRSRSASTSNIPSKESSGSTESLDKETKKSKSKLGFSNLFRSVKRRIQKC